MALTGTYVPPADDWVRRNIEEYEATNGEQGGTLPGTDDPVVVMTTVGARSGLVRKSPVMRVEHGGAYLAVASNGAAAHDPAWADNLRHHPEVELQDKAEKHAYVARELSGPEREEWWERAVATWPRYATYQEQTERLIPIFLLERA